jgi:fucose permease
MSQTINKSKLFSASCFALITTAMAFGLRAGMVTTWQAEFNLTTEQVGWITGTAFWGFTLAMLFGGPIVDSLGMKKLLMMAFFGHLLGIILTIFASGYWTLFISTLIVGIANGTVEAACNPLVSSMYTNEKTKMLNRFHLWFPGGIVIGALFGYILGERLGIPWRIQIVTMLVPCLIYGYSFLKENLPETERVSSGVSTGQMFSECIKPLFIFMVLCMLVSASTELGTGQLITKLLEGTISKELAILVLVFINVIMVIGRYNAGFFVSKISIPGMLLFSAVFSALGLYLLSSLTGNMTWVAAGVFAVGVCFFWPTMLGFVSEYLPKTGAVGLAIMGGGGMLSVAFILPILGKYLDQQSGAETLRSFSILPMGLIIALGGLYFIMKDKKPTGTSGH